jgi:predicted DNA-binding protein
MPNPFLGVRIPPELEQAIFERMQHTGQSKSDIVIAALKTYLELPSCHQRLTEVEERLAEVESALKTHQSDDSINYGE